jgi:hypothetical protein
MTKEEKKTEAEAVELLEAEAVMGRLLLQEKQYQSVLQQLAPKINEAIIKVQQLAKE